MKDLAQDVAEDVLCAAKDGSVKAVIVKVLSCPSSSASGGTHATLSAGIDLRGPGGACPPRLATTAAVAVFVQLTLR